MARYLAVVESAAALSGTAPVSGGATNGAFASIIASATAGFKLRRLTFGVRAGATVPTSQQLSIAAVRCTARGTQTATATLNKMDPNSAASAITSVDTAWSAAPTATYTLANYIFDVSFNSQSGVDLPFELLEEFVVALGLGNGLVFFNVGNALPAAHLYTATMEWEE